MMMITCEKCRLTFNPSFRTCPKCNHETPRNDRVRYLEQEGRNRIMLEQSPIEVRSYLTVNGMTESEADALIQNANRAFRRENRRSGILRLLTGLGMLVLGVAAICAFLLRFLGAARIITPSALFLLAGGSSLVGFGLRALLSGGFSVFTGENSILGLEQESDGNNGAN